MSDNVEQNNKGRHRPAHFKVPLDEAFSPESEETPEPSDVADVTDPLEVNFLEVDPLDIDPLEASPLELDPLDVFVEPDLSDEFGMSETPDPFVSVEDPYPYETSTTSDSDFTASSEFIASSDSTADSEFIADSGFTSNSGSISPDDTADFLAAALESKNALANKGAYGTNPTDTSVYYDVERYRMSRQRPHKYRGMIIALTVFFVFLVGAGVAATVFISSIDSRLTKEVTPELREQLEVPKEPGEPFYLLLLGVDKDQSRWEGDSSDEYGADEHNYRSDSIMLCRVDPKNVKVTMVSIHRDTLMDLGPYGKQKINAAYSYGGPPYTTEVVSDFAGVPITHYAEIDLDRFISIVDQVGGVTVNLPVPVYDPDYTGLNLPAGEQTLNGTDAALLCRCRHGYDAYGDGDRFRAANQRMVFSEIIKKVLNSDPATIAGTITTMADSVTTDMTIGSILELASQMRGLDVSKDIMTGMEPTDGVIINDTWYEICIEDEWKAMMKRVDQGLSPYDESKGEYDSTAGIAGGVGEEGDRQAAAAVEADKAEAIAKAEGTYVPEEE